MIIFIIIASSNTLSTAPVITTTTRYCMSIFLQLFSFYHLYYYSILSNSYSSNYILYCSYYWYHFIDCMLCTCYITCWMLYLLDKEEKQDTL